MVKRKDPRGQIAAAAAKQLLSEPLINQNRPNKRPKQQVATPLPSEQAAPPLPPLPSEQAAPPLPPLPSEQVAPPLPPLPAQQVPDAPTPPPVSRVPVSLLPAKATVKVPEPAARLDIVEAFDNFKTADKSKQLFKEGKVQEGRFTDGRQINIDVKKDLVGKLSIHSDVKTLANLAKAMKFGPTNPVEFTHLGKDPKGAIQEMLNKGISVKVPASELSKLTKGDRDALEKFAKNKNLMLEEIKPPQPTSPRPGGQSR